MIRYPDIRVVKKEAYKKIVSGFLPKTVYVSLNQNKKENKDSIVKQGDRVEEGQQIADGIYSPIPGIVNGFEMQVMPDGTVNKVVKISLDGKFSFLGKKIRPIDYKLFTSLSLIRQIEKYGILNTFVTDKPVEIASQLTEVAKHNHRIIVARLFDEDPSRLIDSVIASEFVDEILEGIRIVSHCIDAEGVVFVVSKDFKFINKLEQFEIKNQIVKMETSHYPLALTRLICSIVKKQAKDELFKKISRYDLFTDSCTLFELFRCVTRGMPSIDRYILVNGNCLPATGILKVALGTSFESIIEQCGGFIKQPSSIIINGQITGLSSSSLNVAVTKYVKSITFNSSMKTPDQSRCLCIRCGNCRICCPVKLSPDIIYRHLVGGAAASSDYMKTAKYCIECGLCNSSCPSRLPIMQKIEEYKKQINSAENEEKNV